MDTLNLVLGPVVGGVIGYITNALAIRMLFRPHRAKYICGVHVPFTPGIIPKEKGRIALSLGTAISDNLMNRETLEKYLLSDDMLSRLRTAVDTFCFEQQRNRETVRVFMGHYIAPADVDRIIDSVRGDLTAQIARRMAESDLAEQIAAAAAKHVSEKLRSDKLDFMLPAALRLLGDGLKNKIADLVEAPVRKFLAGNINSIIERDGQAIVASLIDSQTEALAETPVCDLLEGKDRQIEEFAEGLVTAYKMVITEQLPRILAAVDIPKIIEGRINEMDISETERLIFQVMDKELKAIIWLGALLGCVMGLVNSFW